MSKKRRVDISNAMLVLEKNYRDILTVHKWADDMGYSRSHFCRIFKKEIKKRTKAIGYEIASNTGLADSKSLCKFFKNTILISAGLVPRCLQRNFLY